MVVVTSLEIRDAVLLRDPQPSDETEARVTTVAQRPPGPQLTPNQGGAVETVHTVGDARRTAPCTGSGDGPGRHESGGVPVEASPAREGRGAGAGPSPAPAAAGAEPGGFAARIVDVEAQS